MGAGAIRGGWVNYWLRREEERGRREGSYQEEVGEEGEGAVRVQGGSMQKSRMREKQAISGSGDAQRRRVGGGESRRLAGFREAQREGERKERELLQEEEPIGDPLNA